MVDPIDNPLATGTDDDLRQLVTAYRTCRYISLSNTVDADRCNECIRVLQSEFALSRDVVVYLINIAQCPLIGASVDTPPVYLCLLLPDRSQEEIAEIYNHLLIMNGTIEGPSTTDTPKKKSRRISSRR